MIFELSSRCTYNAIGAEACVNAFGCICTVVCTPSNPSQTRIFSTPKIARLHSLQPLPPPYHPHPVQIQFHFLRLFVIPVMVVIRAVRQTRSAPPALQLQWGKANALRAPVKPPLEVHYIDCRKLQMRQNANKCTEMFVSRRKMWYVEWLVGLFVSKVCVALAAHLSALIIYFGSSNLLRDYLCMYVWCLM